MDTFHCLLITCSRQLQVGPAGLPLLLAELAARPLFVAASLGVFFAAAQLMFWLREREATLGRRVCPVDVLQKEK